MPVQMPPHNPKYLCQWPHSPGVKLHVMQRPIRFPCKCHREGNGPYYESDHVIWRFDNVEEVNKTICHICQETFSRDDIIHCPKIKDNILIYNRKRTAIYEEQKKALDEATKLPIVALTSPKEKPAASVFTRQNLCNTAVIICSIASAAIALIFIPKSL